MEQKIQKRELRVSEPQNQPYMGYAAVILGVIGIPSSVIFTVLGLVCSFIALFMGQFSLAFIGILLGIAGVVTSPILLSMIGLSTFAAWLGGWGG